MASNKRKHEDSPYNGIYSNKSRAKASYEARVDPTYGQRSALPGLDYEPDADDVGGELQYDDDGLGALNYLRAVRKEASGIPTLLCAPREPTNETSYDTSVEGYAWYEDGAYYSSNLRTLDSDSCANSDVCGAEDPHLKYFDAVLIRYEALHAQLRQKPPAEEVAKLSHDHPTSLGRLDERLARWWRWKMRTIDPLPAQIASMEKGDVLRLLGLMTGGTLLKRGSEVEAGVSRWAWALLARLPDPGELTSEEIGVVRELGKKAVLVSTGLREEKEWKEGIEEIEASFDTVTDQKNEYGMGQVDESNEVENGAGDFDDDISEADDASYNLVGSQNRSGKLADNERDNDHVPLSNVRSLNDGPGCTVPEKSEEEVGEVEAGEVEELESEVVASDSISAAADIAAAKTRILGLLDQEQPQIQAFQDLRNTESHIARERTAKWNTKATIDMIITVIGEIYGQRDLLEFRTVWPELK